MCVCVCVYVCVYVCVFVCVYVYVCVYVCVFEGERLDRGLNEVCVREEEVRGHVAHYPRGCPDTDEQDSISHERHA